MKRSTAQEATFQTRRGTIAAKIWGDSEGMPALALHGWLDNAASFDTLAPLLPELNLVALDLAGHGLSDPKPPGSIYHLIDTLPLIQDIVDELGWSRFFLIGHSLGAAIFSLFAGISDSVEKLVLIEGIGPLSFPAAKAPDRLREYIKEEKALLKKSPPIYPSMEAAAEARHRKGDLSLESARILASRGLKPVPGGFTWRSDPRLRLPSPSPLTEDHVLAFLAQISAPTLLLSAIPGLGLMSEGQIQGRIAAVRGLTIEKLVGGHHVHLDNATIVAPPIRRFLGL